MASKLPMQNKNITRIGEKSTTVSRSRRKIQRLYTPTTHWNLEKLLKIFNGTIVRLLLTGRRLNGIAERTVRRVKEGTSFILLQSRLDEQWWAESVECKISKISCQVGKLCMNGGLKNYSVGQSYYSDQKSKIIPLGHFHGLCSRCGEEGWKGDLLVADADEFQENDASEVFKENLNKSSCADRRRQIHNPMCKRSCEVGRKR